MITSRTAHRPASMLWLGVVLSALLCAALPAGAQGAAARVRPDPAVLEIGAGQVELLNLVIDDAAGLYAIDLRASFDPAVVEVVDADAQRDGVQMLAGPFLKPDFLVRNTADNAAGTLQYVITQVNPSEPASGSGVVLSILLRGKAEGARGSFTIDFVEVADRRGNKLPITPEAGELAIVAPKPGGPSPAVATAMARPAAAPAVVSADQAVVVTSAPGAGTPAPAAPGAPALVRLDPAQLAIAPGDQRAVAVVFENAREVYGVEMQLRFDPAVLEVVDAEPGTPAIEAQPAAWLTGGFVAMNRADNTAGTVDFAATLLNPAAPVSGNQLIALITLRGKGTGNAGLSITRALLANRDGMEIASQVQEGQVTVGAAGQAAAGGAAVALPAVPAPGTPPVPKRQTDPLLLVAAGVGGTLLVLALVAGANALGRRGTKG